MVSNNYERDKNDKNKKHVLMQLQPKSAPHSGTQKVVPRGPNFCQESPPPLVA